MLYNITELFCLIDDFSKIYMNWKNNNLISDGNSIRNRPGQLSLSELMTIFLYFYLSPCKDFKNYYEYFLKSKYPGYFKYVSYSWIVRLFPRLLLPLSIMLHLVKGERNGIYYIDSTKMEICHIKRTYSNKVFGKKATIGKSSYGWFMGFKLHMIINNLGEIIAIRMTRGSCSDLSQVLSISNGLKGKIYGDKGYVSNQLFKTLYQRGLRMFTGIRKNMRNTLFEMVDKINMRRRSLVESVFNTLKSRMGLVHTRHRSPVNFLVHILGCLTSYSIKKISNKTLFYGKIHVS